MESSDVRLARIEERQKAQGAMLRSFIDTQEKANAAFWHTVGDVKDIKARAAGGWWVILQMGSLTTVVAGVVAWIVSHWKGA